MDINSQLSLHRQTEQDRNRDNELLRAAHDCPGCIVHRGTLLQRVMRRLRGGAVTESACCEVCCPV